MSARMFGDMRRHLRRCGSRGSPPLQRQSEQSKHAAGRIKDAIGVEIEVRGIRQDTLNMCLIDCSDFKLAVEEAAAATGALPWNVFNAGP